MLVVHVTHFNSLMWDCSGLHTKVIEHGVTSEGSGYNGRLEKGIVVINNLPARGRLLGLDIFERVAAKVPLDLVGMGTEGYGIGEVLHPELAAFIGNYRFFFNPIRYTSMGLAVCEAMMLGMPIVGLATTEMVVHIQNGYSGFIDTQVSKLIDFMQMLLEQPELAAGLGKHAREYAQKRFHITRFTQQWETVFNQVAANGSKSQMISYEK